jgi:hypothetical protein
MLRINSLFPVVFILLGCWLKMATAQNQNQLWKCGQLITNQIPTPEQTVSDKSSCLPIEVTTPTVILSAPNATNATNASNAASRIVVPGGKADSVSKNAEAIPFVGQSTVLTKADRDEQSRQILMSEQGRLIERRNVLIEQTKNAKFDAAELKKINQENARISADLLGLDREISKLH